MQTVAVRDRQRQGEADIYNRHTEQSKTDRHRQTTPQTCTENTHTYRQADRHTCRETPIQTYRQPGIHTYKQAGGACSQPRIPTYRQTQTARQRGDILTENHPIRRPAESHAGLYQANPPREGCHTS